LCAIADANGAFAIAVVKAANYAILVAAGFIVAGFFGAVFFCADGLLPGRFTR
jgi:hypothetical protein